MSGQPIRGRADPGRSDRRADDVHGAQQHPLDQELDVLHARAERIIAALTDLYGQLDDLKRQIRAHQQRRSTGGRYRETTDQHRVSRR